MSKEHTELASKILKHHTEVRELETFDSTAKVDKNDKLVVKSVAAKVPSFSYSVPLIGVLPLAFDGERKDADKAFIEYLAGQLDSGDLVLSDDWADNNLG